MKFLEAPGALKISRSDCQGLVILFQRRFPAELVLIE